MRALAVLGMASLLLALFFQCCPSASSELAPVEEPTDQGATPPSEPPPEETTAPPPPAQATPTSPPPTATPAPQTVLLEFSGQGNEATQLHPLHAGLIRCTYTYIGDHNFIVQLLDSRGNWQAIMANEIGSCEGSSAGKIGTAGDYLFNVMASGDWTLICEANASGAQASSRQPVAVIELSGQGNEATDFIHLESGLLRADYSYVGEHNFIVQVLDAQGDWRGAVANEIGSCEGSTAANIGSAGDYLLDVMASGAWTITLSQ